ncbi:flagellar basal body L-ring protein FlgH [Thermocrinis minervae]|uniref:Flagellar L-ring protein FlgH n=1 Tax=Thermocrinis minervae TaxID=381751 RepID=A0A1M6RFJ4_9AQUI|nr:flagellar basal body L-ring protein FlgH [Thermocrinis minervae]SHK31148.1 flagellar L-ring protein precursor FlgH [Thermocrinis minervae]
MFSILFLLLAFLFSCSQKATTLEQYEKENPYPGKEGIIYASKNSLMPKNVDVNMYADAKASRVGDVIFINVVESLRAVQSVANQSKRSASVKESVASFFGLSQSLLNKLSASGSGSFNSSANAQSQNSEILTTTLAGRVMKVYPNGTMLVEARKTIYVNGSNKEVVIMGIVRQEDLDSSNTVPSNKIANLYVFVDGKGFAEDGGTPGWLARIFAKVLPF